MTTFTDDFNRADGALTSPWTVLPTFSAVMPIIASNQLTAPTHQVVYYAFYNSVAATADHFAQVTAAMTLPASNLYSEATLLLVDANGDGYQFSWALSTTTGGTYDLYRITSSGDATVIDTAGVSGGGTRVLRIEHDGTTVVCYADGAEVLSVADATFATDFTGLGLYRDQAGSGSVVLDTWSGGDFSVGGTVPDAPSAPVLDSAFNGRARVTAVAPADGGSAITGYVWQTSDDNGAVWDANSATTLQPTLEGLTNGTSYKARFAAVNANGQGAFSPASNAVTPVDADVLRLGTASSLLAGTGDPLRLTAPLPSFLAGRSADGTYLVDQRGKPWLCVGITSWSIVASLTTAQITTYVNERSSRGMNAMIVSIPEPYYAPNATPSSPNNVANQSPFTDALFASDLNEPYWQLVDFFLELCRDKSITVYFCPWYIGYSSLDGFWDQIAAITNAQIRAHADKLIARYPQSTYPNITWFIGHDRTPDGTILSRGAAFVDQLRNVHGDTRPLIYGGEHLRDINGTDTFGFGVESWSSTAATHVPTLDSQYDYSHWPIVNADTMAGNGLPWIFLEGIYQEEQGIGIGHVLLRQQIWGPFVAGACGAFVGLNKEWCFDNKPIYTPALGWIDCMPSKGSVFMQAFGRIVNSQMPWWYQTHPDTTSTFVTNRGTGAGRVGARFNTKYGIIYHPAFTGTALTLDLTELSDWTTVSVTRIDPVTGIRVVVDASEPTSNSAFSLAVPGLVNSEGNDDWLFVVEGVS